MVATIDRWNGVWAEVVINVRFENDENTFVTSMPVYEGVTLEEALASSSRMLINSFARDAYYRAKEKS